MVLHHRPAGDIDAPGNLIDVDTGFLYRGGHLPDFPVRFAISVLKFKRTFDQSVSDCLWIRCSRESK